MVGHLTFMDESAVTRLVAGLRKALPEGTVATDERTRRSRSSDYHWFSQILTAELGSACADVVVTPADEAELTAALAVAYEARAPVTLRGGGTGNFGQCVPLAGGLVISTSRLEEVTVGDGHAFVQPGATFAAVDRAARSSGQELPIFPTTYRTATVGGFVAGGSAGVGSPTHGGVPDGYVRALQLHSLEAEPVDVRVEGAQLWPHLHDYGTAGVISGVEVVLVARRTWEQAVISFDSLWACHDFCLDLLLDSRLEKRLITALDPGLVVHYRRTPVAFAQGRAAALVMVERSGRAIVDALAATYGGVLDLRLDGDARLKLYEYAFNHSTLWAKKADPNLTYMQASLQHDRSEEQLRAVARAYPDCAFHLEYLRWGGAPLVEMLPVFPFQGRQHLEEMMTFLGQAGVLVGNPHTFVLEEGSDVDDVEALLAAKNRFDPADLLNPGKLSAGHAGASPLFGARASMALGRKAMPERTP